jgi:hypothetical protein
MYTFYNIIDKYFNAYIHTYIYIHICMYIHIDICIHIQIFRHINIPNFKDKEISAFSEIIDK